MNFNLDILNNKRLIKVVRISARPFIAVVLGWMVVYFSIGKITPIASSISEKRTASFVLDRRIENINKMRMDLSLFGEENYLKIEESLPKPEEAIDVISLIERIGSRLGIKVNSSIGSLGTSPLEVTSEFKINSIDFSLAFTSSSRSLERFLGEVEALPYFITISGVDVTSQSQTAGWNSSSSNVFMRCRIYVKEVPPA